MNRLKKLTITKQAEKIDDEPETEEVNMIGPSLPKSYMDSDDSEDAKIVKDKISNYKINQSEEDRRRSRANKPLPGESRKLKEQNLRDEAKQFKVRLRVGIVFLKKEFAGKHYAHQNHNLQKAVG